MLNIKKMISGRLFIGLTSATILFSIPSFARDQVSREVRQARANLQALKQLEVYVNSPENFRNPNNSDKIRSLIKQISNPESVLFAKIRIRDKYHDKDQFYGRIFRPVTSLLPEYLTSLHQSFEEGNRIPPRFQLLTLSYLYHLQQLPQTAQIQATLAKLLNSLNSGGPDVPESEDAEKLGEVAEILSTLNSPYLWGLDSMYYKKCIEIASHTEVAEKCFRALDDITKAHFSGSRGTNIPAEQQVILEQMRELAQK
jgi:hypothetical protein